MFSQVLDRSICSTYVNWKRVTNLALVAINMETAVEGNHPDSFIKARFRHDRLLADTAARGKLLVEVVNAVNLVSSVYSEGDAIQGLVAHDTREAAGVIWLTCRS